jgi:hypothetical protein
MESVRQNGLALRHASEELKKDKDIILEALMNTGTAMHCIPPELLQYDVVSSRREQFLNAVDHDDEPVLNGNARAIPPPAVKQFAVTEDIGGILTGSYQTGLFPKARSAPETFRIQGCVTQKITKI